MYYLNKDSKSRWIQEYHINLSIRHIQTYVVMVPQGVSNTITLSTWELLHQRKTLLQRIGKNCISLRWNQGYYESLIQQTMPFASFIAKYIEKNLNTRGGTRRKIGWGCAARFPKPLPYLWPKSSIFPTLFMT